MHTVTCPHCNRSLRVSDDVIQAKMKCRYCGAIFVGSTRDDGASPPQAGITDAAKRRPRPIKHEASPLPSPRPTVHARSAEPPGEVTSAPNIAPRREPEPPTPPPSHLDESVSPELADIPSKTATRSVKAPAPPASQPRAGHRHPHRPTRRGVPAAVWGVLLLACLAAAGVGLYVLWGRITSPPKSQDVAETPEAPSSPPQDAALTEPNDQDPAAAPAATASPTPAATEPPAQPAAETSTPTPMPRQAPPALQGPGVRVMDFDALRNFDGEVNGYAGTFSHDGEQLLRQARIQVRLQNADGAAMTLQSRPYDWIPPELKGRWSIDAGGVIPADAQVAYTLGPGESAPENYVGWALPDVTRRVEGGKILLEGQSRNPYDFSVKNVQVLCDFFNENGTYAGSATGTLRRDKTRLDPNAEFSFSITYEPPLSAMVTTHAVVRLIAERP